MVREEVIAALTAILQGIRRCESRQAIDADADLIQALGLDSLDLSNLVVEIEHAFPISVTLESVGAHNTLNALASYIEAEAALGIASHRSLPAGPASDD